MSKITFPFLSAEWRNLLVINYKVDPAILKSLVPTGTELDEYNGEYFVSLVGFLFKNNRFAGLLPTYPCVNFEEANLRFYVKRNFAGECRKGVAFVREVVPSKIIASIARSVYNEPYVALPMSHQQGDVISYTWESGREHYSIHAKPGSQKQTLELDRPLLRTALHRNPPTSPTLGFYRRRERDQSGLAKTLCRQKPMNDQDAMLFRNCVFKIFY